MARELAKVYKHKEVEDRIYRFWLEGDYFKAVIDKSKTPFTIVIPPPNVTGQLHMGHALDETYQDILIRYKRMQGYCTLWLPGTDHAGIATQIKVEEHLRKTEGLSRHDLGREAFLERVWDWKEKHGSTIIEQLKKLGSSCDWSRERFTMDEGCSRAVREVFVSLYEKGLIYRGSRIINWCPHCVTALSDTEVEHSDREGHFWHIKYPVKGRPGQYLVIATTRPETMLGDTAVAVHPDDERFKDLVGQTLILPLMNREIPVIADEYVDREFGTGCVKITPSHDPNDFEVGKRHGLEEILVLDENGVVNENGGPYRGLERYEARRRIVADLQAAGLLVKTEPVSHSVGACYRCGTVVEPMTSRQWFVKMAPLAGPAIEAVNDGRIRFVPERFGKIYINWMENVHDWCISRQLWWGHRIPAFYCGGCGKMTVSREDISVCPDCGSADVEQDEDVLDTWFSSALWPFSTLGWPEDTEDLRYFYPTSVLVTAYDIIFFWVARMIFSAMEHMKREPFGTVLIHGLLRDSQGRKMSKSLGNGIDPLELIDSYGADALRFTLATNNSPGNDMRFSYERVEASRNFANKIWNAARFALLNLTVTDCALPVEPELADKWILAAYNELVRDVTENLDRFELGLAVAKLYDFIWDLLCDWYIELIKPRLFAKDSPRSRENAERTLSYVLSGTMKLLHPFMPFITEEIWQVLPHEGPSIMVSEWPRYDEALRYPEESAEMERVIALIRGVRARRAEMNVPPSKKASLCIDTPYEDTFRAHLDALARLASASPVVFTADMPENAVMVLTDSARAGIPLEELVDRQKELVRLEKQRESLIKELSRIDAKLQNVGFVEKAPAKLVESERAKRLSLSQTLKNTEEAIKALSEC